MDQYKKRGELVRELLLSLGEDPQREGLVTTAENIAVAIWGQIQDDIAGTGSCRLYRIRLFESRANFVDYYGPASGDGAS